ncbi:MAG: hypothetical protein AAFY48_04875 [Bacteroidota bacterium]
MMVRYLILLLLLAAVVTCCEREPVEQQRTVWEKLLQYEEVRTHIAKSNSTLIIRESEHCRKGDCESLFASIDPHLQVRVYEKMDLFMRRIREFVEIEEVAPGYMTVKFHTASGSQSIEISE